MLLKIFINDLENTVTKLTDEKKIQGNTNYIWSQSFADGLKNTVEVQEESQCWWLQKQWTWDKTNINYVTTAMNLN